MLGQTTTLSPAVFKIGDYPEETKFVKAVPIAQRPKVKLNKFPFT